MTEEQKNEDNRKYLIERMVRRLDPQRKRTDIENVHILIDEGIHHGNFELFEIREYFTLSQYETFISTIDNKFFLNEESGELFILMELL
jgi:hypothetical protein